jgi:plasmid stabilization system protein ParE
MRKKQFKIELSEDAESDFEKSYEYYLGENSKVADLFYKKIDYCLHTIKQNPYSYSVAYKHIRKYIVKKYPFVIYYIIEDSIVRVVAIFHSSRNPEIWNERI